MSEHLRILFLSAEVAPYAKVGGLADVAGALPKAIHDLGHRISLAMPKYGTVAAAGEPVEPSGMDPLRIRVGEKTFNLDISKGALPNSEVPVYFLGNDDLFGGGVYSDPSTGEPYADNLIRFVVFSIGSCELLKALGTAVDVIHLNDHHVGFIPLYLRHRYPDDPVLGGTATAMTIHNLAYQGDYPMDDLARLDLPKDLAREGSSLETWGRMNLLKAGLVESDVVNAVSETYAKEIQTEEYGAGLDGVLRARKDALYGILNGADYSVWDPQVDSLIPNRYAPDQMSGKTENKRILLEEMDLPVERLNEVPVVGIISRLVEQKGFDIIEPALSEMMGLDLQMVVLGTGDERYHALFEEAAGKNPEKLAVRLAFDNRLAHLIEAGSDMFLMPSRYEPSGLNQIYSLRYGTVPIVRATGGLADTVVDYAEAGDVGTGFVFEAYESRALVEAVGRAVRCYRDRSAWAALMDRGMRQDFSWSASARKYVDLYREAVRRARERVRANTR